jgi:thiosulfate/3-mercaptopyruvate sulfurtransferase
LDPSAARIFWTLLYFGHEKTKILDGGIRTWHKKGLPIIRDITKTTATKFIPKVNSSIRIEAEELHKN